VGDKITLDERVRESNPKLEKTYQDALKRILQIRDNIMVERKETEDGGLIAFCVDWRLSRNWDEAHRKATPVLALCKDQGMYVVESNISPFANIFPFEVDKGAALVKLRKEMGVTGPVMYLGDSEADDPAFQLADISVGIKHRRVMPPLKCKYKLEFFELEVFLSKLIESNFNFQDGMLQKNIQAYNHPLCRGVPKVSTQGPGFLPSVITVNRYRAMVSLRRFKEYEWDFPSKARVR